MTPACMGGMCARRDRCERHLTDDRRFVAERLCERGQDGVLVASIVPAPVPGVRLRDCLEEAGTA